MGNTTQLSTTRLLHHSVHVAHHLFQVIMLEIMATSAQTGVSVRDLLLNATSGNGHATRGDNHYPRVDAIGQADADPPSAQLPAVPESAAITEAEIDPADHGVPLAAQADVADGIAPSFPPHLMAKRTAATGSCEGITDDCVRELEGRMQRLQDTMDTLIGAIDEFRDDVVHTLRNLPDRLPPPLHIHSLPLDPTDPDFAERVNGVPLWPVSATKRSAAQPGSRLPLPLPRATRRPPP